MSDPRTFHCTKENRAYYTRRRTRLKPLCGSTENDLGPYYPAVFFQARDGTFWIKCEKCMDHPNLPLLLLGDLP